MKRRRFSEQQTALEQARSGLKLEEVFRMLGVSQNAFYRWRKKYGPMQPSEIKRLKQPEGENRGCPAADLRRERAQGLSGHRRQPPRPC